MYKLISRLLKRFGYQLMSHAQVKSFVDFTLNILEIADNKLVNNKIDSIVFSKDSAMQKYFI